MPVATTLPPLNYDSADFIKDNKAADLRRLLIDAKPAELSREGEIERLAKLYVEDPLSFGGEAAKVAKKFNIKPVSALEKAVKAKLKLDPPAPVQKAVEGDIGPDDMWDCPISDAEIIEVCDIAARQMGKYVHTHKLDLAMGTMWSVFTHFLRHETIYIGKNPRLIPTSIGADCGKTTALNCIALLVPRAYATGDTSGPMFVWIANKYHPTALYDELDKHLKNKEGGLYPIFLIGYTRKFARKGKMEKNAEDNYEGVTLDAWMALAGTSVGPLPDDQLNARCIYWHLFAATPAEVSKLDVLDENDFCPVLNECRRKIARWAHDLKELPEVRGTKWEPRTLKGKARLNWSILMRVAVAVGGHWPSTLLKAALRAQERAPEAHDWTIDFLRDVRTVMVEKGIDGIWSETLAEELPKLDNASRDWERLNLTKQAVSQMLKRILHQHCDPPTGTKSIRIGKEVRRGVLWRQLQNLFDRHLSPLVAEEDADTDAPKQPSAPAQGNGKTTTKNNTGAQTAATNATSATPLKTKGKKAPSSRSRNATGATSATRPRTGDGGGRRKNVADVAFCSGNETQARNEKSQTGSTPPENVADVADVAGECGPIDTSKGASSETPDPRADDTKAPFMTSQPLRGGLAEIPVGGGGVKSADAGNGGAHFRLVAVAVGADGKVETTTTPLADKDAIARINHLLPYPANAELRPGHTYLVNTDSGLMWTDAPKAGAQPPSPTPLSADSGRAPSPSKPSIQPAADGADEVW
jgi:hypothetical protein